MVAAVLAVVAKVEEDEAVAVTEAPEVVMVLLNGESRLTVGRRKDTRVQ